MAFRDRIEVVIDFVTTGAQTGLQKLRTDVAAADTATGKAKAGITAMGGALSQYGAQAALAAGAALVAFGAKSVQAFNDSALAAGKFADATGLTTEDASRLIEVAGDLGVSADAVQSSIQRVNNAAAKGDLAQFGIEMGKSKDGAYDANQTFLNTITAIGGISSAAEREAAARKLMGRSWAELAEFATMSAEDLAAALGAVSDEKIFDDAEVQQAREYRAAMDQLKDAVDDVTLAAGKGLTPVITDLAEGVSNLSDTLGGSGGGGAIGSVLDFINPLDNVTESFKDLTDGTASFGDYLRSVGSVLPGVGEGLDRFTDNNERLTGVSEFAAEKLAEQQRETELLADETDDLTEATDAAAKSNEAATRTAETLTDALKSQYDQLREATDATIGYEQSVIDLESAYDGYIEALGEASADGEVTKDELLDLASTHNGLKQDVLDTAAAFAEAQGATEGSSEAASLQVQELERLKQKFPELATFIQGHIDKLNAIPRTINTQLNVIGVGVGGEGGSDAASGIRREPMGTGAPMAANSLFASAVAWWSGRQNAGSGTSVADSEPSQRDKFAKEFERAKRRYEVGDLTAEAYLRVLNRLASAYKFKRLSAPWLTLWREKQSVLKDIRDARDEVTKDREPGDNDAPPREPGGVPAGPDPRPRSGAPGAARMAGAGSGVTLVINAPNAVMVDRKAVQEVFDRFAPQIQQALTKHRSAQG
jgi:hypothetical protein